MSNFIIPDDFLDDAMLLVGNSALSEVDSLLRFRKKVLGIIGVDGGAEVLRECGVRPDIIVGDFDSISVETLQFYESVGVKTLHISRQDNNDLEKALQTIKGNVSNIILIGFLGGRFDHTLATLFVLKKYLKRFRFFLPYDRMELYVLGAGNYEIKAERGQLFSLFAFDRVEGISLKGFKYNLDSDRFYAGSLGLSNVSLKKKVNVQFRKGRLIIVRST